MRERALPAALVLWLGLTSGIAAAQGPGEGIEGDTHEQQQMTDPNAQNRGADEQDRRLTQTVRQAIGTDDAAKGVTITTRDTVVILSGTVPSQEARRRLIASASKVSGVTRVTDQMEIGTPPETGARGTPHGAGAGGSTGRTQPGAPPAEEEDE